MQALASAVVLGFILGLQHATDPDHVVAVATIVTREGRLRDGALVGVLWGFGHTLTVTLAGSLVVAFGLAIPARLATGLELAVAVMLVVLGAVRLRDGVMTDWRRSPVPLARDHDHGDREALHRHRGASNASPGKHLHLHPSRALLGAFARPGGGMATRAVLVGIVHGLAGTAALSLLVLATLRSVVGAALYLLVFGAGTIVGMTTLATVMAYPLTRWPSLLRARRALTLGTGLGAIAYGVIYAARLLGVGA